MEPLDQHRMVHHAIRSIEVPPHLRHTFASNIPVMKGGWTILLLILSNTFMTFAWYGHLRFKDFEWSRGLGLFAIILISWGVAFFEYSLMVPANRLGHVSNGGPFNLVQLKVIQEVITLVVFAIFTTLVFRNEVLRWQHGLAAVLLVIAVWLVFKK
jgi:uncharacterized protein